MYCSSNSPAKKNTKNCKNFPKNESYTDIKRNSQYKDTITMSNYPLMVSCL